MKILVAEDEATTRLLLAGTLRKWGYDVVAVEDGEAAWGKLQTGDFRLVLCDWEMPGMDGVELSQKIRGRSADLPYLYFVLITNHADSQSVARGLAAGADDYLRKPFDPVELRARLEVGSRLLKLQDQLLSKNKELDALNDQLRQLASTDALTSLENRRSLDETAASIHDSGVANRRSYGLLILDIDHFKSINDRFGHPVGDAVLSTIAAALRDATRGSDRVFRYGGEEYVVIFPDATAATLSKLAERLRGAVAQCQVDANGEVVRVTTSVGAALFDPGETVGWREILRRADAALYVAKQSGRDRTVVHATQQRES